MVNNDDLIAYKHVLEGKGFVNEKHYRGAVYHSTGALNALGVMRQKEFQLRPMEFHIDKTHMEIQRHLQRNFKQKKVNHKYKWYLSVARGRTNSFRAKFRDMQNDDGTVENKFGATQGAVFVLDGSYFSDSSDYVIGPLDYFAGFDNDKARGFSEQEERIWSKKDNIPLDPIRELHIYAPGLPPAGFQDEHGNVIDGPNKVFNDLIGHAKLNKIPFFFYDDLTAFTLLNKKKAKVKQI